MQPSRHNGFKLFFKEQSFPIFYAPERVAQFLASYFEDPGIFSMFFFIVFLASKDLGEKKHGKFHGTRNFDASTNTHSPSASVLKVKRNTTMKTNY